MQASHDSQCSAHFQSVCRSARRVPLVQTVYYCAALSSGLLTVIHCLQHLNWRDKDCRTLFGWNHYPDPVEQGLQPNQLRLLPHADTDVITLLFQRPGNPCVLKTSSMHTPEQCLRLLYTVRCPDMQQHLRHAKLCSGNPCQVLISQQLQEVSS